MTEQTEQNEAVVPEEQATDEMEMDDIFGMITSRVEELKTDQVKKKSAEEKTSGKKAEKAGPAK